MTFGEDGRTFLGTDPACAAVTLTSLGADVVGINCSLGPAELAGALGGHAGRHGPARHDPAQRRPAPPGGRGDGL